MSIFDNLTAAQFKTQFPRFTPQYLTDLTYSATHTYFVDDEVYYEGIFYKCIKQSIGNAPTNTTYWSVYNDSVLNYTQDSDILNAYNEAKVNFNESLFRDEQTALMVFLYLAAHYLTIDFNNAIGANAIGIPTSKSVGSVSEGFTIPPYITNNPALSAYANTGFGIKYGTLIYPYLIGNVMLFKGGVTTA